MSDEATTINKDWRAFRVLRDTALARATFYVGENADGTHIYETEGVPYAAGDVVLEEDLAPNLREFYDAGRFNTLLEEIDREDALTALNAIERGTFAPEHAVEAEALAKAGHRILDRETIIELRSLGAEDARAAQEAAKAGGADDRPNLTVGDGGHNLNDTEVVNNPQVPLAEGQQVSAEEAEEAEVQVTPSGVKAVNTFAAKAKAKKEAEQEDDDDSGEESESSGSGGGFFGQGQQ